MYSSRSADDFQDTAPRSAHPHPPQRLTSTARRMVSKKERLKYLTATSASAGVRKPTKPKQRDLPSLSRERGRTVSCRRRRRRRRAGSGGEWRRGLHRHVGLGPSGPGVPPHLVFMTLASVTSPLAAKCSRRRCSSTYLGRFLTHMREVAGRSTSSTWASGGASGSPAAGSDIAAGARRAGMHFWVTDNV